MTDELMKRLSKGETVRASELKDAGPFMVIAGPKMGALVTDERALGNPTAQKTPQSEKVA